ncbi:hypothetical protein J6590_082558 [Homalodisca vitripennis]|nr:hypothetical protein J6590_082558 [Homalodisca vitripennis]
MKLYEFIPAVSMFQRPNHQWKQKFNTQERIQYSEPMQVIKISFKEPETTATTKFLVHGPDAGLDLKSSVAENNSDRLPQQNSLSTVQMSGLVLKFSVAENNSGGLPQQNSLSTVQMSGLDLKSSVAENNSDGLQQQNSLSTVQMQAWT